MTGEQIAIDQKVRGPSMESLTAFMQAMTAAEDRIELNNVRNEDKLKGGTFSSGPVLDHHKCHSDRRNQ
eukprot:6358016-Amphidinium_carterae.1